MGMGLGATCTAAGTLLPCVIFTGLHLAQHLLLLLLLLRFLLLLLCLLLLLLLLFGLQRLLLQLREVPALPQKEPGGHHGALVSPDARLVTHNTSHLHKQAVAGWLLLLALHHAALWVQPDPKAELRWLVGRGPGLLPLLLRVWLLRLLLCRCFGVLALLPALLLLLLLDGALRCKAVRQNRATHTPRQLAVKVKLIVPLGRQPAPGPL